MSFRGFEVNRFFFWGGFCCFGSVSRVVNFRGCQLPCATPSSQLSGLISLLPPQIPDDPEVFGL